MTGAANCDDFDGIQVEGDEEGGLPPCETMDMACAGSPIQYVLSDDVEDCKQVHHMSIDRGIYWVPGE